VRNFIEKYYSGGESGAFDYLGLSDLEGWVVGAGVEGLDDGDVAGGEASLAVFEVVVPGADKGFVEAEGGEFFEVGVEALVPLAEGLHVVGAEVFEVVEEHVGGFGEDIVDAADAHEETPGEDDFLDPVDAFGEALVSVVRDGDHLDGEEAIGGEDFVAFGEEGLVEFIADGFDHFDGYDFVELAFDVAVVLDEDLEFVFQPGVFDALAGILGLLFGDGDAGDFTSVFLGGVAAEASPAAADFEDVVICGESEFFTEGIVFRGLGVFESGLGVFEFRAGVGHRFVEPERVEFVAEIVVLGDVFTACFDGVSALEVAEPVDDFEEIDAGEFVRGGIGSLEGFHVIDEPGDDTADVGGVPDAIGVSFAHADVSVVGAAFEKFLAVVDFDFGGDFAFWVSEFVNASVWVFHAEFLEGHFLEEPKDEFFGERSLSHQFERLRSAGGGRRFENED